MTERAGCEIERRDGIAVLRMTKPPANAIDSGFLADLQDAVDELTAEPPAALVHTGAGRFFSGGIDLKAAPTLGADDWREMLDRVNRLCRPLFGFPRPVVSAVNGHATGAGFVLALAGDHRVAALEGSYGLTEVRAGMAFPAGALAAIEAELPAPSARRLVLGAELVDANTAVALGAFDEVAPAEEVLPRAIAAAERLAAHPSEAFAQAKLALRTPLFAAVDRLIEHGDPLEGTWIAR